MTERINRFATNFDWGERGVEVEPPPFSPRGRKSFNVKGDEIKVSNREGVTLFGDPRRWSKEEVERNRLGEDTIISFGLKYFFQKRDRTSFLVAVEDGSTAHHEPEYCLLKRHGKQDEADMAAVVTTRVGHLLIHQVHLKNGDGISGQQWTIAQIKKEMTPRELAEYEKLKNNKAIEREIEIFIRERKVIFGIG